MVKRMKEKKDDIKAILFDYDGVIVDSIEVGIKAYEAIAKACNIRKPKLKEEFKQENLLPFKELYKKWGLNDEQIIQSQAIYLRVTKELQEKVVLIPGIKEILSKLSEKYRLAIASGTRRVIIEERLKQAGLYSQFEVITTGDDVHNHKPAPDVINLALERLEIKADQAIFVGDMALDIQMGKAAGIKTIILCSHSWNEKEALKQQNPDILIEKPEQLLEIL